MRVQDFFLSRPVLYGAPAAAAFGAVLALGLQVGAQTAPYAEPMSASPAQLANEAEPIAWPGGKVPDYVIGTDFLRKPARWDTPIEVATAPISPDPSPAWRFEPEAPPRPAPVETAADTRWPSVQGDIVNVSLPEDAPAPPSVAAAPVAPASSMSVAEAAPI